MTLHRLHRCQFSERNWKLTYFSNLIRTLFRSLLWFFVAIVVLEVICYLGHVKKCNVIRLIIIIIIMRQRDSDTIEFAKTSAMLEFYLWFWFRPYHRSQHVILHESAKFYQNLTTLGRKKMTLCRFSRWQIFAILDFSGPIMGFLKSPCTTSCRSSIETIALNCLVFEKIAFLHFGDRQTNELTDRWTSPSH